MSVFKDGVRKDGIGHISIFVLSVNQILRLYVCMSICNNILNFDKILYMTETYNTLGSGISPCFRIRITINLKCPRLIVFGEMMKLTILLSSVPF